MLFVTGTIIPGRHNGINKYIIRHPTYAFIGFIWSLSKIFCHAGVP